MNWIRSSFKRQVLLILFISMSLLGFGSILKNYVDETQQLNIILESQVMQLNNRFALSISSKIFYNELYEISDAIFNLYEYNYKNTKDSGALFLIKDIAVVDMQEQIIGHSHPRDYFIGIKYHESFLTSNVENRDEYTIYWNNKHNNLYVKTPIYMYGDIIAYLYMNIDPIFLTSQKKQIFNQLFIFGALFLLFLIIVSFILAKLINKPMHELLENLKDIGSGNLNFSSAIQRKDEFSLLPQLYSVQTKEF